MDSLNRLEEIFAHFPGIGPRQAKRFVYYLLNKSPASIKEFTQLIEEVKKSTAECSSCHRFFIGTNVKAAVCPVCSDSSRDTSLLMVVARDSDFESIEKSGAYRGLYFILGGTVPILDKEPEKRIRLNALVQRLTDKDSPVKEVILSLNATPDGENTAEIVGKSLEELMSSRKTLSLTKVSVLGRGLSTGAELEYVDADTIKSALQNRH
jgi:recombination protein RecR